MFTLAHLSDLHLGPLPGGEWTDYLSKRAIGFLSWRLKRVHIHQPEIAAALVADVKAHGPDHVAVTGDLVNIALPDEFVAAAKWLKNFGPPDWITVVPGNHDAYVGVPWAAGAGLWSDYMTGDLRIPSQDKAAPFPFVRQRRNITLIGLSSAIPQGWRRAGGELGARQLAALARILADLGTRGYFRIILIHHPPLPGQAPRRKELADAPALKAVLQEHGAEMVLHGHNHWHLHEALGATHIIGVPSASAFGGDGQPGAAWNLYRIERRAGLWQAAVTIRAWDDATGALRTEQQFTLDQAQPAR